MNPAEKLRHYIGIDLSFYDEHNVCLWMERKRESLNCFTLRLVTQLITVLHVPKIVTNEFIVHAFIIQLLNELQ